MNRWIAKYDKMPKYENLEIIFYFKVRKAENNRACYVEYCNNTRQASNAKNFLMKSLATPDFGIHVLHTPEKRQNTIEEPSVSQNFRRV